MKMITLFLLCFCFIPVTAQTVKPLVGTAKDSVINQTASDIQKSGMDSLSLSQLVQAQIDAAKKKEIEDKNKPAVQVQEKKIEAPKKTENNFWLELRKNVPLSDDDLMKAVIIASFSFMAFVIVFLRRMRLHKNSSIKKNNGKKKNSADGLKKNIAIIREERPLKIKYKNKLKAVRAKLISKASINLTNEAVTKTARELQISKGEVLLAARIKSHEIMNGCTSKK